MSSSLQGSFKIHGSIGVVTNNILFNYPAITREELGWAVAWEAQAACDSVQLVNSL